MKRNHPLAFTVGAALVAAVLVMGAYLVLRPRNPAANAASRPPAITQRSSSAKPSSVAAAELPNLPPPPPGSRPTSTPVLPEAIRNNATPPPLPDNLPNQEELREQFAMLRRFLELPPDKLSRMRESIERIERMPPERKKMMLDRIRRSNPSSGSGPVSHDVLSNTPAEVRARVSILLDDMTPAARAAIAAKTSKMTPEERAAFFEGMAAAADSVSGGIASPGGSSDSIPWSPAKSMER